LEDFDLKIKIKKAGKKILYLPSLKVKHHHDETLSELFRTRYVRGYWATVIFDIHKEFLVGEEVLDNTIKSMYLMNNLTFPFHLLFFLLKNGPKKIFIRGGHRIHLEDGESEGETQEETSV
jgi:GT2 family glycosyltransferase